MSVFKYEKDSAGIVTVTMDMTGPVNSMNEEFNVALQETVERLEQEQGLNGVIISSAKKTFFAGGDLKNLLTATPGSEQEWFDSTEFMKSYFRRLEKLPVPVVAAINGAALGGGFEVCLSCNYRIAWSGKGVQIGLPEVTLGLLPGAGGVVRMTNMLGLEVALPYLLEGKKVNADKALKAGLIHETVAALDELLPRAKAWITEQKDNQDAAIQPWDRKNHRIPGGSSNSPSMMQLLVMAPAMIRKKTRGLLPAPESILAVAVEAARLDFDTALRIESRHFVSLLTGDIAKNMITAFFFNMMQVNNGGSRPKDIPRSKVQKVGILGAGMMGQGIAYVSAMAGIEVVLKDISEEAVEKGRAYSETLLDKRIAIGRLNEEGKNVILNHIQTTTSDDDLQGCDLIIEAVFENVELKNKIIQLTECQLAENGVWGSNTSTLPINQLAEASSKPENFIGIHFFSPVDKMPLVEIICGDKTSDETLAKAFDYTQQIRKVPIVVNDSLGFYTSRTFGTYLDEGARLLSEGLHPIYIDSMGKAIGMPVGPLAVHDETSQQLSHKMKNTHASMGLTDLHGDDSIMRELLCFLVEDNNRGGRHHNGGFYDYKDAEKTIWPELLKRYHNSEAKIDESDIKDRLLFRSVIETLKCYQEGVLRSVADANIGSIMGIGAPAWTGGYIQFVNTYGLEKFIARCDELSERYGERFNAPTIVAEKLSKKELFI